MHIIDNLEKNIQNFEKYVDVKRDKLSEVLKFFYDDMLAFDRSVFAKTEQVRIFEKALGRDIKYITYVSIFNRLTKDRSSTKMFNNNDELDSQNEVQKILILSSNNEVKKDVKKSPQNGNSFMENLVSQGNKNVKNKKEIIDEK